jgi:BlaI family penicillinase repressor
LLKINKEVVMARKKTNELTEGEWAIVKAVWENEPCAAPTVQEELEKEKGWSYSTVKTMMDRMVEKGLLKTERIRNLTLYRSAISKQSAQRSEIMKTVKRAFDGAMTPMMQFLLDNNHLSKEELSELEEIIKKKKDRSKEQGA